MENENIKNNILEKIYFSQEEKIDEIIKQTMKEIKDKLNDINTEEIIEKYNIKEIKDLIEKIEENNNIKISYLIREIYKQGFADGVGLIKECIDK